jgi:hypothetical protein
VTDDDGPKFYTGQDTFLKRMASVVGSVLPWIKVLPDKAAIVFEAKAPDIVVYPRAFKKYLARVKLPGEDGLTEYQRLKANAAMFQEMIAEERAAVLEERREKDA